MAYPHDEAFMLAPRTTNRVEREMRVDIFEERDRIRVVAELPGVREKDIRVDFSQDTLLIFAGLGHQRYHKEIKLPHDSERMIGKAYYDGILVITLK